MTETELSPAAQVVKDFRQTLIDAGYRHANGAGELVSADDRTWVGTSYVHGMYIIHAWRRPHGHAEIGEKRWLYNVVDGHVHTDEVTAIANRLKKYAKQDQARLNWPPKLMTPVR